MGILIDIILIFILIANVVNCTRHGMIRSLMNAISLIISLISAWIFYPALAVYYQGIFLGRISAGISDSISSITAGGLDLSTLFADRPEMFTDIFDRYKVAVSVIEDAYYSLIGKSDEIIPRLSEMIAQPVTYALANLLAFLSIFLGIMIVLKIVTWILDMVFALPVLNTLNHVGGFIIGLVCGSAALIISAMILNSALPILSVLFPNIIKPNIANTSVLLPAITGFRLEDAAAAARKLLNDFSI